MRYLSIDTETTGLDPENCQILSFAVVLENTEEPEIPVEDLPSMHIIFNRDFIQGEPFALNMNKELIEIIKEGKDERLSYLDNFGARFRNFLEMNDVDLSKIKVAGKNFSSFDKKFLDKILDYKFWGLKIHHRVLDVGSVCVDFKNDNWIPTLDQCMQRTGVDGSVTHDALEDARDVIRVLRKRY